MSSRATNVRSQPQEADVLIVDDDEWVCARLGKLLKGERRTVLSAGSLDEARHALQTHRVRLLIVDRRLGDDAGLQLCREFRASANGAQASILVLSVDDSTGASPKPALLALTIASASTAPRICSSRPSENCWSNPASRKHPCRRRPRNSDA